MMKLLHFCCVVVALWSGDGDEFYIKALKDREESKVHIEEELKFT